MDKLERGWERECSGLIEPSMDSTLGGLCFVIPAPDIECLWKGREEHGQREMHSVGALSTQPLSAMQGRSWQIKIPNKRKTGAAGEG